MKNSSNKALLALTAAALGLPGIAPRSAQAEELPEKFTASYRFTEYQEDSQPAVSSGGTELPAVDRYEISVNQFSLAGPLTSDIGINVSAISETLSGASPWYIVPDAEGNAIQIMSGATIEESREELNIGASFYRESSRTGLGLSYSSENDYESVGANVNNTIYFNGKNTTVDFGFSFSIDEVTPTQDLAADPGRVTKEDKDSSTVFGGVSQVVNQTLLVGANASYTIYDGFLSDPYKQAFVTGLVLQRDTRPDNRKQASLDLLLRKYFRGIDTALHVDYRLYDDSWGINSNTISLGVYKNIGSWQVSTKFRYYDQSSASFYRIYYTAPRADGFYSSDYRLSEYDAVSYKVGISKRFDFGLNLVFSYEQYDSNKESDSNPGLVDFDFFTVGLDYSF